MKRKINLNYLILDIMLLLPITTLLQGIIPPINRICLAGIIILLIWVLFRDSYKVNDVLILCCFVIVYTWALFVTDGMAYHFNDYLYFMFFVLFSYFIMHKQDLLRKYCSVKTKYIVRIIQIWNLIILLSMFFEKSYEEGYFLSFTGDVFRVAASTVFILALIILIIKYNKLYILYALLPMYCLFAGGSRTYLVIGLILLLILIYMICPSKRVFWCSVIPTSIVLVMIIMNSSIMNKFIDTTTISSTDYWQDPLFRFTSGRSLFWMADMKAFFDGTFIKQVLGFGFNYVYDVNYDAIRNEIWAHNDYINILLNFGILGLVIYINVFFKMFKACTKNVRLPMFVKWSLIFVWFFNAFFNMYYTYICASVSYPFVVIAVTEFIGERERREMKGVNDE